MVIIYFDDIGKPHEAQEIQHNDDGSINLIYKLGEFKRNFVFDNSEKYGEANQVVPKERAEFIEEKHKDGTIDKKGIKNCYKVI